MSDYQNGHRWQWTGFISSVLVSVISASVIQLIIGAQWIGSVSEKVAYNDRSIRELYNNLAKFDQEMRAIIVVREKILYLEKQDEAVQTRLTLIANRLDGFMQQVNRLDTPLSKRVEGLETILFTLREATNIHNATSASRIDTIVKRQDAVVQALDTLNDVVQQHLRKPRH
jgi:hypothetical protein